MRSQSRELPLARTAGAQLWVGGGRDAVGVDRAGTLSSGRWAGDRHPETEQLRLTGTTSQKRIWACCRCYPAAAMAGSRGFSLVAKNTHRTEPILPAIWNPTPHLPLDPTAALRDLALSVQKCPGVNENALQRGGDQVAMTSLLLLCPGPCHLHAPQRTRPACATQNSTRRQRDGHTAPSSGLYKAASLPIPEPPSLSARQHVHPIQDRRPRRDGLPALRG
jgi:hypothetical protein